MNPEDPTSGFRHGKVLMFINEQMSKDTKGPAFYLENLSLSWEEVEEKLRILLENGEMLGQAQEACAWASLALGVRFAWRQVHLQGRRVQWLHDFACLHRSAAHALASDLKKLTDQQEMDSKEAAFQLQLAHTKLAEVQRDRDQMRLKLLHARFVTPMRTLKDYGGCQHQMQARTVTVQPFNRTLPWSPVDRTTDRSEQDTLLLQGESASDPTERLPVE
ncbi:testis-expressed protein 13B isoform X1, partial [Cricetulus griseus]|uniref:testis-expressed protein 13B isoform X1 n=1 Tax=Cricetulus griseus TaxID=10029 RepID=UPI00022F665D